MKARRHLVLIPGFAGFDALGQLEYYSGVTPLLADRPGIVLHYFDNFPTAAVMTRAGRLEKYLAKRIARGEIAPGDEVTLVGHSTGGLDIRQLLWNLPRRKQPIPVDGGAEIASQAILDCLRQVIFLSVPHWGTNIADWVRSHTTWREVVITELESAVAGCQVPGVDSLEERITGRIAALTDSGLFYAIRDCLTEADARTADSQEAASALDLYLRHMATDFRAIDDLASAAPPANDSPAHFSPADREKELRWWERAQIAVRSYVTLGRRPFRFQPGHAAPLWELAKPWTWPELTKDPEHSEATDIVYRTCYGATAGGPFVPSPMRGQVTRYLGPKPDGGIEIWDNDGIVNTASMLWPEGENVLVPADHMDIVGHFQLRQAAPGTRREYQTYDLLSSASEFTADLFRNLWEEILSSTPAPALRVVG